MTPRLLLLWWLAAIGNSIVRLLVPTSSHLTFGRWFALIYKLTDLRFDVIDDPLGVEKFQGHENGTGSGNYDTDNSDYRFDRENHRVEVLCAE